MNTKEIINILKEKQTDFLKTTSFSKFPGIYALFFIGNDFPFFQKAIEKNQIIYIGKTESSQEKRDAKTHFTTGKTGSSTVRKSIGALLRSRENLIPIQRNDIDYENGRFNHFKFDLRSEEIITAWMKKNLALAFYEFPEKKQVIEQLETEIIQELEPILNIDYKNPENPYNDKIKKLRKDCATITFKQTGFQPVKIFAGSPLTQTFKQKAKINSNSNSIYINNITESDVKNCQIRITSENKHLFPTEMIGKPITYVLDFIIENNQFTAKYTIGSKDNKIRSGVLKLGKENYQQLMKILKGTNLKISKSIDNRYIMEFLK